jgi:hypothetical protein
MKSSAVIASVLFSTMALAAPVDRRAYATKTEVKVEYYTVYTTVTGAQPAAAAATSDPALFYEDRPQHNPVRQSTAVVASSSTSSIAAVPTIVKPEPTYQAPPPVVPTTTATKPLSTTTSAYTPPPAQPTTQAPPPPPPTSTQAPPPPSSVVPEPQPTQTQPSNSDGEVHSGGSLTMNYYGGGLGACGDPIGDNDDAVALAVDVFGDATVDYMTGKTTNKWCGKTIEMTYEGRTATAQIKDRCPGCTNGGLDLTKKVWDKLTNSLGGDNGDRVLGMTWRVVG